MSDETTPRPWGLVISGNAACGDPDCCGDYEEYAQLEDSNGDPLFTSDVATSDLIVTAVNQHDALVAFVEAVRGLHASAGEGLPEPNPIFGDVWLCSECDQNYPCDTAKALDDLDAQIGGN